MGKILEAGHYYRAKGPTEYSALGWKILEKLKTEDDKSLLFLDDVHPLSDVPKEEQDLPTIPFAPQPDFTVMESEMDQRGIGFLDILRALSKTKRAKLHNGSGIWHCSGQPLTDPQGRPLCLLLDGGLTLHKRSLGFNEAVNILPNFTAYAEEQRFLLRLIAKAMPEFKLTVILFDLSGKNWVMEP